MKIKHLHLLLLLALCMPWSAKAQNSIPDTLSVNYGSSFSNSAVPIASAYADYDTQSQFILLKEGLMAMTGGIVNKMTFYCKGKENGNWGNARFSIYVAEVLDTEFTNAAASYWDWDSMSEVYTGSLSINNYKVEIVLDTPFTYNGGNLKIGFKQVQAGSKISSMSWRGVQGNTNGSMYYYSSAYSVTRKTTHFRPRVTFDFEVLDLPTVVEVTVGDITANTASLSWEAPSTDVTGYKYQYSRVTENFVDSWLELPQTATSITLENLAPNTNYVFRIKACYGAYESVMTSQEFRTGCPDYASIPYVENFDSYEVPDRWIPAVRMLPDCWDYINTSSDPNDRVFPTMHHNSSFPQYTVSLPNSLQFYIDTRLNDYYPSKPQYIILPAMQNINGLRLKLYARAHITGYSYTGTFKVGVMEGTETEPEFVEVETITPPDSYQLYTIDLSGYEGNGEHIVIWMEVPNTSYGRVYIDDIVVEQINGFSLPIASHEGTAGGWYLISSPLADAINPENVSMLTNDTPGFDLYRFNPAPANPGYNWENWKQPGEHYHFNLEPGRGYLYANHNTVNLGFNGTPYDGNGEVALQYNDTEYLGGWNLVGNPFSVPAYIGDRDYYKMNEERSGFVAVSDGSPIGPMEGIFVYTEMVDDTVTFSTIPTPTRGEQMSVNISKVTRAGYNTTIDRAILRFDEGHRMPKFQLNEESAKIYIPQNGMDYAIITAEEQGEMPINFSADENGTYTLSFNIDNLEFGYLHLIDNKTGNDIDLLVPELADGPVSYTFNATTTDYESRFKLVYATGNSVASDSFTFINSNGSFSIFGIDGEATLQVFDMMGRVLSTETFSGSIDKQLNVAPGVYFIRLMSGEDVKTQKIVVR